ncbi:MAG: hypothetical protein ACPHN3_10075, partial [Spongiibacter sp.]
VRNVVFGAIEHYLWDLVSGTRREDIDDISDQLTQLAYSGIVSRPDNISSEVNQLILKLNTLIN